MYLLRYVWEGKGKGKALILEGIQCVSSSFDAFSGSWAYRTSTKTAMSLTQFQLVHGVKVVLLIECEIPSLKLAIELLPNTSAEEEHLVDLECLD